MTEQTATEAPTFDAATLDDFGRMAVDRLVAQITQRNSRFAALTAASGDKQSMLDDLRENSQDPQVVALREQISDLLSQVYDLETQRDAILTEQINATLDASKDDVTTLESQVKADDSAIKAGSEYLAKIYGKDILTLLPPVTTKSGKKTPGVRTSGGGGGRRYRGVDVYVNDTLATTPDANGVQRSTFSAAAKVLGLDSVKPLQEAVVALHGDDNAKWPAEFTFEFGDSKVRVVKQA